VLNPIREPVRSAQPVGKHADRRRTGAAVLQRFPRGSCSSMARGGATVELADAALCQAGLPVSSVWQLCRVVPAGRQRQPRPPTFSTQILRPIAARPGIRASDSWPRNSRIVTVRACGSTGRLPLVQLSCRAIKAFGALAVRAARAWSAPPLELNAASVRRSNAINIP
jgi:hypothetical protein